MSNMSLKIKSLAIASAQGGNGGASLMSLSRQEYYAVLYSGHHQWLKSWLLFRKVQNNDVDDLVQDTYVRLLTSNTRPEKHQARRFIIQIAKGLMIDQFRRKILETAYYETLTNFPPSEVPSEEERYLILEQLIQIDLALKDLPDKVRQTFLMSRFQNLTYLQIASHLSVSVGSVRKYMLQALKACMNSKEL